MLDTDTDIDSITCDNRSFDPFSPPSVPPINNIALPEEDDISNLILSNIVWDDSQFDLLDSLLDSL